MYQYLEQEIKSEPIEASLMLLGMANYFFLFGFAILGVFYALFRYFQCFKANKGRNLKVIGNGALHYLLGILMVAYVLLPALGIVGNMSRVEDSSLLLNFFKLFFVDPSKTESGYHLGTFKSFAELFSKENLEAMRKYFFEFIFINTIFTTITSIYIKFIKCSTWN